jgi:cyclophilin family peptidyl-prolyl cis-trans isomerase
VATDVGTFTIGLARGNPEVVNSFVYLARYHYYRDLTFDRVIPGFVVQGGDLHPPTRANPSPTGPQGPGYTVRGTVPKAGTYQVGTVAMAKTGSAPAGTAGAQFFVIVGPQGTSLPPDYTVLGHVTSGMKVVNRIAADGGPQPHGYPKVVHKMRSVTISPG